MSGMWRGIIRGWLAPVREWRYSRRWSDQSGLGGVHSDSRERRLAALLKQALPGVTRLDVQDISGGCGAMFEISVEAKEFVGLSTVKQHRLVTDSLKTEIAEMHGIRIHTNIPE